MEFPRNRDGFTRTPNWFGVVFAIVFVLAIIGAIGQATLYWKLGTAAIGALDRVAR